MNKEGVPYSSKHSLSCSSLLYSLSLFCNIYIINVTLFCATFSLYVQNLTVYIPELRKLLIIFCATFNPPAQEKVVFKWHQLQNIKTKSSYMYRLLYHSKICHFAHRVYLFLLCSYQSQEQLFPQTALATWSLQWRQIVSSEARAEFLNI